MVRFSDRDDREWASARRPAGRKSGEKEAKEATPLLVMRPCRLTTLSTAMQTLKKIADTVMIIIRLGLALIQPIFSIRPPR